MRRFARPDQDSQFAGESLPVETGSQRAWKSSDPRPVILAFSVRRDQPAFALLASAAMFPAQSRQTFSGTITDEECPSADHSGMRMGSTDAACAIACVDDHTVEFVLFDGKATYLLSDQDKSREFAGKKVAVVGTLDSNTQTIQVNSMAAAN